MKRETFFLKLAVILLGIAVLALCIFVLPWIADDAIRYYPKLVYMPILIGMYGATIPFYYALFQAFKILSYIDNNNAFSDLAVNSLKKIKYSATIIGVIYGAEMPLFYIIGERDDAPGIILVGLVITSAAMVIAVFAGVLQKLLKNAIEIKNENDLTV